MRVASGRDRIGTRGLREEGGTGRRREQEALGRGPEARGRRTRASPERSALSFAARSLGAAAGSCGARGRRGCGREGGRLRRAPRPRPLTAAAGLAPSAPGSAASAPSGSLPSASTPPAPVRIVSQLLASRPVPGCFPSPGPSS